MTIIVDNLPKPEYKPFRADGLIVVCRWASARTHLTVQAYDIYVMSWIGKSFWGILGPVEALCGRMLRLQYEKGITVMRPEVPVRCRECARWVTDRLAQRQAMLN